MKTYTDLNSLFKSIKSVVFLHAHPDDETFLSAGLINKLSKDKTCYVVYLAASKVTGEAKTQVRQKEASAVCGLLGVKKVIYLEYCEPKYRSRGKPLIDANIEEVTKELEFVLDNLDMEQNLSIISYDSNGGYGNKDHIVLNKIGRNLLKRSNVMIESFFEVTINRNEFSDWFSDSTKTLPGNYLPKLSYWRDDFGTSESNIDIAFELSNEGLVTKKMSLYVHESQINPSEFPLVNSSEDFKRLFGREYLSRIE